MPNKKTDDIIFRELGNLQEKVLFYLAENPEKNKQAIQQGINHPSEQYGSVKNAVDKIEEFGFIQSTEGLSQKKVKIKIYRCADSGVFYALTKNHLADVLKILDAYKSRVEFCSSFRKLYDAWGHEHFTLYLRDIAYVLPIIQKDGIELAMPHLLMKILEEIKSIDKKTRKRNANAALELFPESKKWLTEWRDNLDELI
jgi:hypothetical protein